MTSLLESLPIINCLQVVQFLASESIRHWRPISRSLIPSTNSLVTKKNHLAFSPRSFETGIVVLALTSCSTSTSFPMRCVANILALLMSNLLWETVRGFSCLGLCLDTCLHRSWMWLWNFGQPNFWFCMGCFHGWIEGCLKGCCDKYIRISFERI